MSIAAYKRTIRESDSPRQIERRVLSRITGDLERFAQSFDKSEKSERAQLLASGLEQVLIENLKFWTIVKHDLATEGNALPPQLRAGLISLALFVERQTNNVIGGSAGVGAMAAINQNVIAGLSGQMPGPKG
jgi:flagellar protein FlaF